MHFSPPNFQSAAILAPISKMTIVHPHV